MYTSYFSPLQLQFYATTTNHIVIVPTFSDEKIFLLGKHLGPFKAGQEMIVPVWLAIFLKEQNKCKIDVPNIFKAEELRNFVTMQNQSQDPVFLHQENFFQLAYTLLNKAPDTWQKPLEIRNLVQSLETIRFSKLRKIIEKTAGGRRLKYFTTFQINKWRAGLSGLQKMVDKLTPQQKN